MRWKQVAEEKTKRLAAAEANAKRLYDANVKLEAELGEIRRAHNVAVDAMVALVERINTLRPHRVPDGHWGWFGVSSNRADLPIALFLYSDQADSWCRSLYPDGRVTLLEPAPPSHDEEKPE